jgi:hypothetical protein
MDWTGLDWTGLDWTGLDWTGLDWTGLDWTALGANGHPLNAFPVLRCGHLIQRHIALTVSNPCKGQRACTVNLGPCWIGGQMQPKGTASGEPGFGSYTSR